MLKGKFNKQIEHNKQVQNLSNTLENITNRQIFINLNQWKDLHRQAIKLDVALMENHEQNYDGSIKTLNYSLDKDEPYSTSTTPRDELVKETRKNNLFVKLFKIA